MEEQRCRDTFSMKKILLHVGTHKTGSTSIQRTLYDNRETLEEHNIHYLEFGSNHWHLYSAFMHNPWEWFEHQRMGHDREQVDKLNADTLRNVKEEIANSHCDNIIISSEYLAQLGKQKIVKLRDYLSNCGQVTVVYYCRELLSWLSSDSQQCAKVGMKSEPTGYAVAIKRLYDFPLNYIEVFGRENFRLIRFEDAIHDGLCNSLLRQCSLPPLEKMGITESPQNSAISAEAVNAFFLLNRAHPLFQGGRSNKTHQILRNMPGRKYHINPLTRAEVADCNKKMRLMRRKYAFPMYDDIKFSKKGDDPSVYSDESITYLLDQLNSLAIENEGLLKTLKELKNPSTSALEEGHESELAGNDSAARERYVKALESASHIRLNKIRTQE
jgi:hypothetical protein